MPAPVPFPPRPPADASEQVIRVRIGRQRIEIRIAVDATDVTDANAGPADVIEMPRRDAS